MPVGAAAYSGVGVAAAGGALFPAALPSPPAADGSALCGYSLVGAHGPVASVHDLLTRTIPAGAAMAPLSQVAEAGAGVAKAPRDVVAALEEASAAGKLLYEPQWQALAPLEPCHTPRSPLQPLRPAPTPATVIFLAGRARLRRRSPEALSLRRGLFLELPAKPTIDLRLGAAAAMPVGVVVARALEVWQRAMPKLAGGSVRLLTAGANLPASALRAPLTGDSAAAGGALWALLRVAGSENPSIRVHGIDSCVLGARRPHAQSTMGRTLGTGAEGPPGTLQPLQADAFGSAEAGGLHYAARLLHSQVAVSLPDCHVMPCPRGALADLRLVPLPHAEPGPGEVKACPVYLQQGCTGE